jgi:hypothetical protein
MAGGLREGSQGPGHPYLTALLLLAMIGGFYVSGGNNLSTIKPVANSGEVTIVPQAPGGNKDNIQLYTFGYKIAAAPGSSDSAAPTLADPDPQNPNNPLPDCPSHGIKTTACQCPTREEVWAYCDEDLKACQTNGGTVDTIPVPGKNPPGKQFCRYSQSPDDPIYVQKISNPLCTLACVN